VKFSFRTSRILISSQFYHAHLLFVVSVSKIMFFFSLKPLYFFLGGNWKHWVNCESVMIPFSFNSLNLMKSWLELRCAHSSRLHEIIISERKPLNWIFIVIFNFHKTFLWTFLMFFIRWFIYLVRLCSLNCIRHSSWWFLFQFFLLGFCGKLSFYFFFTSLISFESWISIKKRTQVKAAYIHFNRLI
jgi:hypothetical protein